MSVVGRANLIKMIWLPQLLYIFDNSSVWIRQSVYKKIDSLFCALIWSKEITRISLTTLPRAKHEGGLEVPHFKLYFLVAQLQYFMGWDEPCSTDPTEELLHSELGDLPW